MDELRCKAGNRHLRGGRGFPMATATLRRLLISAMVVCAFAHVDAQRSGDTPALQRPAKTIALTSLRLSGTAALPVLDISADGPLPEPVVGILDGPPRIYLDLRDVAVGGVVSPGTLGVVARVRVALHDPSPVTRIVIDLAESRSYTLDASQRRAGRVRVSIAGAADAPAPSSSRAAASGSPARNSEARRAPEAAGVRYRAQVMPILEQLATVGGVLQSIDQRSTVTADRLDVASRTLALVHDELDAVRPTEQTTAIHDSLRSACTFASTAVSQARAANGHDVPWTASSAAAGALILLDRARAALQPR